MPSIPRTVDTEETPATRETPEAAPKPVRVPTVTLGQPVSYVWPDEPVAVYAATVAWVVDAEAGVLNLGGFDRNGSPFQAIAAPYDADGAAGTWHVPEAATPKGPGAR